MENAQEQCSKHGRPNKEDKVTACRKIAHKLDLGTAHYQSNVQRVISNQNLDENLDEKSD